MEHARPPGELVLEGGPASRGDAWRKWRKQFEIFLKASGVSKEAPEVQASLLVNLIGIVGYEVYSTFKFEANEKEDLPTLLTKFNDHFGTKPNVTVARYKIRSNTRFMVKKSEDEVDFAPQPRSFIVTDAVGRRYRRNRRHLVARVPPAPPLPSTSSASAAGKPEPTVKVELDTGHTDVELDTAGPDTNGVVASPKPKGPVTRAKAKLQEPKSNADQ